MATKARIVLIAAVLLISACDRAVQSAGSTTTSRPPESTSTTRGDVELDPVWDENAVNWSQEIVYADRSGESSGWYKALAARGEGFVAVGVLRDGVIDRPQAWLTPDGVIWRPMDMPVITEGRLNDVAADEKATVMVGYETSTRRGLVIRIGGFQEQIPFEEPVDLRRVVSTSGGFVAYGVEHPTTSPRWVAFISVDGTEWNRLGGVEPRELTQVVTGSSGTILELSPLTGTMTVMDVKSLFDDGAVERYPVTVEGTEEHPYPYALTAVATKDGYLVGGGDAGTGEPMTMELEIDANAGIARGRWEVVEQPAGSILVDDRLAVRHLVSAGRYMHAVVGAPNGDVDNAAGRWS